VRMRARTRAPSALSRPPARARRARLEMREDGRKRVCIVGLKEVLGPRRAPMKPCHAACRPQLRRPALLQRRGRRTAGRAWLVSASSHASVQGAARQLPAGAGADAERGWRSGPRRAAHTAGAQ